MKEVENQGREAERAKENSSPEKTERELQELNALSHVHYQVL